MGPDSLRAVWVLQEQWDSSDDWVTLGVASTVENGEAMFNQRTSGIRPTGEWKRYGMDGTPLGSTRRRSCGPGWQVLTKHYVDQGV